MLKRTTKSNYTITLLISALAVLLAACSTGTESANNPADSASSPATSVATSSSPQATASPTSVTIPGVDNISEINFKPASKNSPGFFDGVNGSSEGKIEVSRSSPITVGGWAILADKGTPADTVIITYGNTNSLVAVAPVSLERPDVLKALKNPAFKNSGWSTTFNSSAIPVSEVELKAWVYNSATKEATQLEPTHQVIVSE